jgi:hypothetical protein
MASTLSTIGNLLKTQYLPGLVDVFQEEKGVLGQVQKRKKPAKGGNSVKLVRSGRNKGIGFRGDGVTLPSAGQSAWLQHTIGPKAFYGRIQVSGLAMSRTDGGSAKAFLKAFVDESKHTMSFMKKQANIALWGNEEGYLGQVASVTSTELVLDGPGIAGQFAHANFNAGTRHFAWAGETAIDVIDSNGTTILRAGGSITAINHSTNTLTVDFDPTASTAVADGDFVVLATGLTTSDTYGSSDEGLSFEGIASAVSDGAGLPGSRVTYHGLSRTTYPQLSAVCLKNTSAQRDLTEALMEDAVKSVYLNSGVDPMSGEYEFRMSLGMHSNFVASQLPVKRFQSTNLKAGHSAIDFNGIKVVADVDCPYETVYLLNWDNFEFLEVDPLRWLDDDGQVLLRVANQDAYEARLRWFGELFGTNVHSMAVIQNLNDSAYVLRS